MDPRLHEADRLRAEQARNAKLVATRERNARLADDSAIFLTTSTGGCGTLLAAAALVISLVVGGTVALAQIASPTYPQAAYMQPVSMYGDTQTLATESGRWEVQLTTETCVTTMLAASQVWLTAPVESPTAAVYVVAYGDQPSMQCPLAPDIRILRDPTPCAMRDGICDGDREPKPEWWELP